MLEVIRQLEQYSSPTHVFVQGGVGGLAAAVAGMHAEAYRDGSGACCRTWLTTAVARLPA
ncbi:MAG: hypothetical protein ACREVO_11940 [Steroidobacteraceae bacterium]